MSKQKTKKKRVESKSKKTNVSSKSKKSGQVKKKVSDKKQSKVSKNKPKIHSKKSKFEKLRSKIKDIDSFKPKDLKPLISSNENLLSAVKFLEEKNEKLNNDFKELEKKFSDLEKETKEKDELLNKASLKLTEVLDEFKRVKPDKINDKLDKLRNDIALYPSEFKKLNSSQKDNAKVLRKHTKDIDNLRELRGFARQFNNLIDDLDKMKLFKQEAQTFARESEKNYLKHDKVISNFGEFEKKISKFDKLLEKALDDITLLRKQMKVKIEAVDLENFKVVLIDEFKTVEPQKSTQIEERKEKSNIIVDQRLKKIQFLKSKIDEWKSKGLDVSTLEKEVESLEQN